MEPVKIGVIGYRGFGAFCTEAFHDSGAGRVVAFAGRDARAMGETARRLSVPRTYTDWRSLVADPEVELVHIVTPPDTHAAMAVAALQAGKHVLVEKPLATTARDAQAILAAALSARRLAGINFVMRYNPLYQTVARIARAGRLGGLTHVGFENYASDEGLGDTHWFWDRAQSGGIFVEHGVHFFDVIGDIAGAPAHRIRAQTWRRGDGTDKEDRVQAIVSYENGVEAAYYHAFNRPGALERQQAHFAFARGHVVLDGWIPTRLRLQALVGREDRDGLEELVPLETLDDPNFRSPRTVRGSGTDYPVAYHVRAEQSLGEPTQVYRQAVQAVLEDLAQAIRNPDGHRPRVWAGDGAVSLQVALAARHAADTGREQSVPPVADEFPPRVIT